MYEVYGLVQTRTFRVLWMLEELGAPYTFVPTPPRSDRAIALNPPGRVPILKDGATVLSDSVAILTCLTDLRGEMTNPPGTVARAEQDAVTQLINTEMDAPLWTAAKHSFALPEALRVEGLKPTLAWEIANVTDQLAARLEHTPFLCGDEITVPDIVATHCGDWARAAKLSPDNPVFDAYLSRMRSRPAYQRVRALGT